MHDLPNSAGGPQCTWSRLNADGTSARLQRTQRCCPPCRLKDATHPPLVKSCVPDAYFYHTLMSRTRQCMCTSSLLGSRKACIYLQMTLCLQNLRLRHSQQPPGRVDLTA
eukprot:6198478-Pleurochrysis_carterae.AAC.1